MFRHVRLWNIPDKRVVHWTLLPAQNSPQISPADGNLITAVNFCDDGRKVTVGTFDGRFFIYSDSLQYEVGNEVNRMGNTRILFVIDSDECWRERWKSKSSVEKKKTKTS